MLLSASQIPACTRDSDAVAIAGLIVAPGDWGDKDRLARVTLLTTAHGPLTD